MQYTLIVVSEGNLDRGHGSLAQLGEHLPYKQGVTGSSPVVSTKKRPSSSVGQNASLSRQRSTVRARSGSPHLPLQLSWQSRGLKILVSLVRFRSEAPFCGFSSSGRAPPCQGGGSEFEPRNPLQKWWRLSQVVRQRSAKPLFTSSNLVGASTKERQQRNLLSFLFYKYN